MFCKCKHWTIDDDIFSVKYPCHGPGSRIKKIITDPDQDPDNIFDKDWDLGKKDFLRPNCFPNFTGLKQALKMLFEHEKDVNFMKKTLMFWKRR